MGACPTISKHYKAMTTEIVFYWNDKIEKNVQKQTYTYGNLVQDRKIQLEKNWVTAGTIEHPHAKKEQEQQKEPGPVFHTFY